MAVWFDISDAVFTTCCLSAGILAHQQHQYVFSCQHLHGSLYLGARIFLPSFIGYVGYITLWFPSWHQQLFKNYVKLSVLFSPGNDIRALPLSVPLSLPIASCFTFPCHHHFANLKIPRRK